MRLTGSEILSAEALDLEIGRALALFESAPPGEVVVATTSDGALVRAALAALRCGRALLTLDPALSADEAAPLLPPVGLALLDPEPAARWALPSGLAARTIAGATRPSAWQRLLGRKAAVQTFPGCLEGLSPLSPAASSPAAPALRLWSPGLEGGVVWRQDQLQRWLKEKSNDFVLSSASSLLCLPPLHHPAGLLGGLLLADQAGGALIRGVVDSPAAALALLWREAATHLVATPAQVVRLLKSGEDLREGFGARGFQGVLVAGGSLPARLQAQLEEAGGRPVRALEGVPGAELPVPSAPTEEGAPVAERVLAVAAAVLRAPPGRLSLSARAGEVPGWDSLAHLDLITALEAAFGVTVTPRELLRLRTLQDAVDLIEARLRG